MVDAKLDLVGLVFCGAPFQCGNYVGVMVSLRSCRDGSHIFRVIPLLAT